MSTAEILSLISLISYIVAGVSFLFAVIFWFLFGIPSVIGDLSGRTAKKSIARKRAYNEKSGGRGYQPSATNVDRGKLTDTMQHSRKLAADNKPAAPQKNEKPASGMQETEILETNRAAAVVQEQTALLGPDTVSLSEETAPLSVSSIQHDKPSGGMKITMLDDVVLIHTNEVI